jgi:hypothetical protein
MSQADVVELLVHLGCSKEVSSYDITLHNWNGKYSPNGAYPITVGLDGSISLGRAPNCPLLLTLRVEKISYQSSPTESYLTVSGVAGVNGCFDEWSRYLFGHEG